jgi:Tfp pilus assembly protein PilZ
MPNVEKHIEEFKELHLRKLKGGLKNPELERWRELKRLIEEGLYGETRDPARDRRGDIRVADGVKVKLTISGKTLLNQVPNISSGGLLVKTEHTLPAFSIIAIELIFPGEKTTMMLDGRVVWSSREAMGIEFVNLDEAMTREINDKVHKLLVGVIKRKKSPHAPVKGGRKK